MIFAEKRHIWYDIIKYYLLKHMSDVIPFPVQHTSPQGGELFKSAVEAVESNEVQAQVHKTYSLIVRNFPYLFMTPWELVMYLEDIRHPADFDPERSLNEQVYKQAG